MYYNTTNQTGSNLAESHKKVKSQEEQIFQMFRIYRRLTASQAWRYFPVKNTPITSIRRAITDLCNAGKLEKTPLKAKGIYGKDEHIYKLKK